MVFCNKVIQSQNLAIKIRHNPYFNRWFSAMSVKQMLKVVEGCHNPYFNRWFSAIKYMDEEVKEDE